MRERCSVVGRAILPAAAFQAARRLKAGGSQDWLPHTIALTLLLALSLPAQTLDQAEALWKARRFKEANEVFKQLEAGEPRNPDYKVRWGRMMLEHAQPTDAQDLFEEALAIKKDDAGAVMGLALVASENFDSRAGDLAKKALEIGRASCRERV